MSNGELEAIEAAKRALRRLKTLAHTVRAGGAHWPPPDGTTLLKQIEQVILAYEKETGKPL